MIATLADGLLAGPSLDRLDAAREAGNLYGLTDRFDYVFTRGDLRVIDAALIGNKWPDAAGVWDCDDPDQVRNTQEAALAMDIPVPDSGRCFATDHAGVAVSIAVGPEPETSSESTVTTAPSESTDTTASSTDASATETPAVSNDGGSGVGPAIALAAIVVVAAVAGGVIIRRRR